MLTRRIVSNFDSAFESYDLGPLDAAEAVVRANFTPVESGPFGN